MNSSEKGILKKTIDIPRGIADVKPVNKAFECLNDQKRYPDGYKKEKKPSEKGGEGHGESHRPRVRIGESQPPVREEIGESQ